MVAYRVEGADGGGGGRAANPASFLLFLLYVQVVATASSRSWHLRRQLLASGVSVADLKEQGGGSGSWREKRLWQILECGAADLGKRVGGGRS